MYLREKTILQSTTTDPLLSRDMFSLASVVFFETERPVAHSIVTMKVSPGAAKTGTSDEAFGELPPQLLPDGKGPGLVKLGPGETAEEA